MAETSLTAARPGLVIPETASNEVHEWYDSVQKIADKHGMGVEGAKEIVRTTEAALNRGHITLTKQQKHHLTALQLSTVATNRSDAEIANAIIRFEIALATEFDEESLRSEKGHSEVRPDLSSALPMSAACS
jgi:2-hydroxychromene-2-carboxylate isomerase